MPTYVYDEESLCVVYRQEETGSAGALHACIRVLLTSGCRFRGTIKAGLLVCVIPDCRPLHPLYAMFFFFREGWDCELLESDSHEHDANFNVRALL